MHKVKGVVVRAKNEPATVETVLVPDPGPGEALVDVLTCGVCQTDLHYKVGGVGEDFPYLLGHEAAGVVNAVGEGVTEVEVGDHVILNWRAVCGECRACRRGEPWYCFNTENAAQKMTLEDGTELEPALGIGAFAEKTLVAAGQCTRIETPLQDEQYAAVGLLGCGVTAGIGAAINTGAVKRGESVAVIGCGGVGTAAVAGAALAGATTIIAVDLDDQKLATARRLGATHTVNSQDTDPVAAIRELTGGHGADLVIDAVGIAPTFKQAFQARDLAGRVVLVGVPDPGTTVDLPLDEVFSRGGSIKSAWYGDTLPSRDFPMLVDQYTLGRLDLDAFVSERIELQDVDAAFETMKAGKVLRSVVEVSPTGNRSRTVVTDSGTGARVDNCVTSGTFSLDGGTWEVDNNVWVIGNDVECAVIDPAHDPQAVLDAVAGRTITHVLLTHGHDDHISAVRDFVDLADTDARVHLHPEDLMLWRAVYPDGPEPEPLRDGQRLTAGTVELTVLHTPGHSPGSVVFHAPSLGDDGVVFSGDTLFQGGPGATGRSYSDFPTIIESIEQRLLSLPEGTVVLTGHGDATSVGAEKPHLSEWIARGH